MAVIALSGSGRVGEAPLGRYGRLSLSQVLCVYPGTDNMDRPLPNIAAFDHLTDFLADDADLEQLVQWVEPQTTCGYIMRNHGAEGLKRVLFGIARACAERRVHMGRRPAHFAEILGLDVI